MELWVFIFPIRWGAKELLRVSQRHTSKVMLINQVKTSWMRVWQLDPWPSVLPLCFCSVLPRGPGQNTDENLILGALSWTLTVRSLASQAQSETIWRWCPQVFPSFSKFFQVFQVWCLIHQVFEVLESPSVCFQFPDFRKIGSNSGRSPEELDD